MVLCINHMPCKPGAVGSIPGFSSLSDEVGPIMTNTHTFQRVTVKSV